jgi:hypothetical protein
MPVIFSLLYIAVRTTDLMQALSPGESPPDVITAIFFMFSFSTITVGFAEP